MLWLWLIMFTCQLRHIAACHKLKSSLCLGLFDGAMLFGQESGKSRLQQAQDDVEEVKVIMLDNLNKADERSGKLEDLEDRADQLLAKVTCCPGASLQQALVAPPGVWARKRHIEFYK